jgi:PAS domain S-box-containing protein
LHVGRVFENSPLEALAIVLCLATILFCLSLVHRHRNQLDRFLVSLLGFIAVYQILRVVKDTGAFAFQQVRGFDVTMNVLVSGMCLGAALILKVSCADRSSTKVRLRLVEANEKTIDVKIPHPQTPAELSAAMVEASPMAMFTVDGQGMVNSWNAASERLLGWKREEILGSQPPVLVNSEGPVASTLHFRNRSGAEIGAAAWSVPMRANSGTVRGRLTVLVPLTDLQDSGPKELAAST